MMRASARQWEPTRQAKADDSAKDVSRHSPQGFYPTPTLSASPLQLQAKSANGASEDAFEREADRVAEQVMRAPESPPRRACACGGGCPKCGDERGRQEQSQAVRAPSRGANESAVPSIVRDAVSSPGQRLDAATRGFMESRFGQDLSQVRIHTGPRAATAARAVRARAFTLGHDIVFDAGQYAPGGSGGRRLLAHELTHVIQQRLGLGNAPGHLGGATAVRERAPASGVQRQKAEQTGGKAEDAAFWEWWKLVVGFEGSLEDWKKNPANKSDRGGETNWGVTKKSYMANAKALGLPANEEGFAALTPDQAIRFGRMIWKASGAQKVKNTGVALVLADWYWGGIDLGSFSALLKAKGRAATFKEGKPDDATIDFMNTLPPGELVELISAAKAAQYEKFAKAHPDQQKFLKGWLERNEKRRKQAQPFVTASKSKTTAKPAVSIWERGQSALKQARGVLELKDNASSEDKKAARDELWAVVGLIEEKQKTGFAHDEEKVSLVNLKGDLLKAIGKLSDAGP